MKNSELEHKITNIIDSTQNKEKKLQEICDFLKKAISYFDWVGFYFRNGLKEELILAQFSGEPTEHKVIPFGKGICGQVAVSNKSFVVQDVTEQENYLSCGFNVKAEIVIPIFKNGLNIGQLDIDTHKKNPFTEDDLKILEFVCEQVSKII